MGVKTVGEPSASESDARKTSSLLENTGENKTEPFEGKTQTEPEDYPTEVRRDKGEETILET